MDEVNAMLARITAAWVNCCAAEVSSDTRNMMGGIVADGDSTGLELVISLKAGTIVLSAVNAVTKKRLELHRETIGPLGPIEGRDKARMQ